MAGTMRRPLFGGLTVAAGMCALIVGMAAIDDRVRDELARVVSGRGRSPELASVGWRLQEFAVVVVQAVRDQSIEHAPLVIFGLAATVLVLFMLRT